MVRADLEKELVIFIASSGGRYRPNELVKKFGEAHHASDSEVREALWRLLDRRQVQLTPELELAAS
jgi:hypothetical protein